MGVVLGAVEEVLGSMSIDCGLGNSLSRLLRILLISANLW